ncbi:MAG TPA: hypothetical protein VMR37_03700 [Rhabdochlamydiaceae bacterium]|jgi:hypothetical protein|nr:hypothetical protein [Rhabdochlamydiaceae bacterium]
MAKEEIRAQIAKNIKLFDLCALLKLLKTLGYQRENILLEGTSSQISHSNLCHEIKFEEHTSQVKIVINMGLLSSCSSLPSFFQNLIEKEDINSEKFMCFLNFFNHHLIDSFLQMTLPETNEKLFANWKQAKIHYLSLLGFESVSTLWFLMKICFPDLVVEVKKNPQELKLYTSSLVLGRDSLGFNSYLGNRFNQTLSSFKVTFTTDNELSEIGTPWPIEINKRLLDLIFPVLKKTDLHFSIVLEIKNKCNYLILGAKSYLGFDRIWKSSRPFQLLLFYGLIKDLKRNAYLT